MAKTVVFYGTPLSKSLQQQDPSAKDDGPINRRRARLNSQQTVRDDQGRQRFHGAFTGGFSAGYFNTVDTVQGFRPRQFVSRRGNKTEDGSSSSFSHRPEDYMDEEDFGEFGIAPRKLRVDLQYASGLDQPRDTALGRLFSSGTLSIGEKILKQITGGHTGSFRDVKIKLNFSIKNDYHGLGYKPLDPKATSSIQSLASEKYCVPLTAVLKQGKRLKISGEAFGVGVLDDDDDYSNNYNAYGYDNLADYDIEAKSTYRPKGKETRHSDNKTNQDQYDPGFDALTGFVLAKDTKICGDITEKYPVIEVPDGWKTPTRDEPYIPPVDESRQLALLSHQSSNSFGRRFTSGRGTTRSDCLETRVGLVTYSDLKAVESKVVNRDETDRWGDDLVDEASVVRQELEWRPTSLLCKHFNVPNPFPDNKFFGVRSTCPVIEEIDDLTTVCEQVPQEKSLGPATMQLKKSIFDVCFGDTQIRSKEIMVESVMTDSDSEPQIVEISDSDRITDNKEKTDLDGDQDIVVVPIPKKEPEVIVLSSSTSDSPSEDDTYGPPLPPPPLVDLDLRRTELRHRHRRKKRKHKKCKS